MSESQKEILRIFVPSIYLIMFFDKMGMTGFDRMTGGISCAPSFRTDGLVKEVCATVNAEDYSYAMAA